MRFKNLNILVTGATGGIGRAIAHAFAAEGGRVMVADLPDAPVEALVAELGDGAASFALDVTDEAQWIAAMDAMEARMGGIDIIVNNAGFFQPNIPFEEMPLDLWRRHFAVNADGAFLGCKHAILRMKGRGGGSIVNIGSGMSITANPMASAYCGSKAALLMTTRTAAARAGRYNIRVNAVLPGAVDTAMLMGNLSRDDTPEDYVARMASYSPMGRLASVQDIAHGVLLLADPASAAITGIFLPVDCGNMPGA